MDSITRRSLLGSLALGSIYTNVEHSSALQLQGTEANKEQTGEIFWTIARQHPRSDWAHVDFWSKPLCEGAYAAQLPLTIGRGTLMFGTIDNQACAGLSHFNSSLREKHNKLFSNRLCFQSGAGINSLIELLRTRVNVNVKPSRARTTALIALDSRWSTRAGLDWAEILPAFRGCYDQVIGHYHINQRGFHHWKNWMKEGPFRLFQFRAIFHQRCFTMRCCRFYKPKSYRKRYASPRSGIDRKPRW